MSYLNLIVKGNKFQAARAAADRSVPFAFVRETKHGETIGRVPDDREDVVRAWFNEPGRDIGTLLVWSHIGSTNTNF